MIPLFNKTYEKFSCYLGILKFISAWKRRMKINSTEALKNLKKHTEFFSVKVTSDVFHSLGISPGTSLDHLI